MKALLSRIAEYASTTPEAEAVVCNGKHLSYGELQLTLMQVADELASLPISRLALYGSNDLDWLLVDLAAAMRDIPVVPIPLFFSSAQRDHLLSNSGVDAIYTGAGILALDGEARSSRLLPGHYRLFGDANHGAANFSKVTYTSGSTGAPKGACLSGNTMLTIADSLAEALTPSQLGRHLCLLPFATLLENVAGIYLPLWMGRALVIEDTSRLGLVSNHKFDAARFCTAVARHRAESVILLPQMLKALIEHGDVASLSSLKFIAVGGGKVPPELLTQAHAAGLPVYEGYGLTECGSCVALNTPSASKVGSVGRPLAHANVRVSDSGEIFVTGAAMTGYLNDTVEQSEIATGDAGFIDDEGFLFVTGRIKNTIISSFGRNISPEWVESLFIAEPDIAAIAVFGEAQPYLTAVIQPATGSSAKAIEATLDRINKTLPDYAQIKHWICASDGFSPEAGTLTSNGKLCRAGIAHAFSKQLSQQGIAA